MNKMNSLKTYQSRVCSLIGILLGIALLLTVSGPALPQAPHVSYSFVKLETLGDKTPSGLYHINDFEPGGLNNRGDSIYATDLGTSQGSLDLFWGGRVPAAGGAGIGDRTGDRGRKRTGR